MKNGKPKSHLRIPNDILRSKSFAQFMRTKESAVWFNLCGWIVRGQMGSCGLGKKLYEDYFLAQKKLVAHWDQNKIAEHLGFSKKSGGYISTLLKRLENQWKAIRIERIRSHNGSEICVYELGFVKDGQETLYLFSELWKRETEEQLNQLSQENEGLERGPGFRYGNRPVSVSER